MREKLRREKKTHESKLHMLVRAKGSSHQTWTWTWLRAVCLGYSRNFHMEFSHDVNIVSPGIGKMIVNSNFITGRLIFPPSFGPCVCKDFPCYWFFSIQLRWEIAAKFAGRERDKTRQEDEDEDICQHVASSAESWQLSSPAHQRLPRLKLWLFRVDRL